jgi:hypothetical protein
MTERGDKRARMSEGTVTPPPTPSATFPVHKNVVSTINQQSSDVSTAALMFDETSMKTPSRDASVTVKQQDDPSVAFYLEKV